MSSSNGSKSKRVTNDIWAEYSKTRSVEARNRIIVSYLDLVRAIANSLKGRLPKFVDVEDLEQEGVFGLTEAIEGFDLSQGVKFKTYASTRIRGAMLDALRGGDWVPRLVRLRVNQYRKAVMSLQKQVGREPYISEVANSLQISEEETKILEEETNGGGYSQNVSGGRNQE